MSLQIPKASEFTGVFRFWSSSEALESIELINALIQASYRHSTHPAGSPWTRPDLRDYLRFGGEALLAFENEELVALILFRRVEQLVDLGFVATAPEHRQKGRMSQLLRTLFATSMGVDRVWLEVHEENAPALALYLKLGFERVGRRPRYYRDGGAALLLSKPLP